MELANLEDLRANIGYNPELGTFVWLRAQNGRASVGARAGSLNEDGYLIIRWRGNRYRAHRLAWLLTYSRWPENEIDHINGVRYDNRLVNLREATQRENKFNRRRRKTQPGLKGVSPGRRGKFRSVIRDLSGRQIWLGEHSTPELAHAAYVKAAKRIHGEFANFA